MEITNGAKAVLEPLMEENNMDHLRVAVEEMEESSQIGLVLQDPQEDDQVVEANGIKVAVDNRVTDLMQDVTLDTQENEDGETQLVMAGLPEAE